MAPILYVYVLPRALRNETPSLLVFFILCVNVLSNMIKEFHLKDHFDVTFIAKNSPNITHLFFADDNLLFSQAGAQEAKNLINILNTYQRVSGKKTVNLHKFELVFSCNVNLDTQKNIQVILNIPITNNINTYLGIPTKIGQSKILTFKLS